MAKLHKRAVDSLTAPGRERVIWDDKVPGFGIRVKPTGAKSWVIQYRNQYGKSRRLTLGKVGRLTPEEARKLAKQRLAEVDRGADPADERSKTRKAVTVSQLCDQYLASAKARLKPSTYENDKGRIERHVKPLLGSRVVETLRPSDIERFVQDVASGKTAVQRKPKKGKGKPGAVAAGGPGAASRAAGMLRTILSGAVSDGILLSNPAHKVKRPKDNARDQPFSFQRVTAVGEALRVWLVEQQADLGELRPYTMTVVRAVRFLILSGCRRSEALSLQWRDVDFQGHCLRLRDSKTGKQVRPVGRSALEYLISFQPNDAEPTDFVFPGGSEAGHYVGLSKAWERIAIRAGVPEITPHGLRHWFASAAAELNYSDFIIGGMLGHAKRGITGRYANTPDTALSSAADRVSLRLAQALDNIAPSKVVQIAR